MKKLITLPYRDKEESSLIGIPPSLAFYAGKYYIPFPKTGELLQAIAEESMVKGWEHVSISLYYRCPSWEEMVYIKNFFWYPNDTVLQIHPKQSDYVNIHPYCLHLWKRPNETYSYPMQDLLQKIEIGSVSKIVTRNRQIQGKKCVFSISPDWLSWEDCKKIRNSYFSPDEPVVQCHFSQAVDLNEKHIMAFWEAPKNLPNPLLVV